MKGNKQTYLMVGIILIALSVIYFLASFAVPKMLVTLTKAAVGTKVSIGNSRVIGEIVLAKADGTDKCKVNIFVMDSNDKGVPGKRVELNGMDSITPSQVVTDNSGKASFEMTSTENKQYEISATVEGVSLPQTIKVTFRD